MAFAASYLLVRSQSSRLPSRHSSRGCVCMCAKSLQSYLPLQPHGLYPPRLLCPWNFPGKNTGVGRHALLQGIFLTQWQNPHLLCLLYWQAGSFTTSATWEAHQRICWPNFKTITWSTLGRNICRSVWWWTGRPGVLRFMGSQRVGHDWATELNWWLD